MKIGMISGARGQDASLLARLLLDKGYKVVAFERHTQSPDYTNIQEILGHKNYILEKGDVTDLSNISRLVKEYQPHKFFHLAANSFVGCSWNEPIAVFNTNAGGCLNCLEAVRSCSPKTKFLFASTSEVVGNSKDMVQNEETPHTPHSPYAVSKTAGEHFCHVARFSYGIFACYTRCYNHESIYRGREFVTRKVTDWIGKSYNKVLTNMLSLQGDAIANPSFPELWKRALDRGLIKPLLLGNLNSSRDWLAAEDCVRGMDLALDLDKPDDFVLASGKMHSIRDLLNVAFSSIGIDNWKDFVGQDPRYLRPDDVVTLCGDYSKAKRVLGWEPTISFEQMISNMVHHDIKINRSYHNN